MNAACVRHTELPGTSKLFADFLYHYDRVAAFYPSSPAGPVDFPADRRAAIVEALSEINPGSKLLDQLAQPGTVAVVTGQQVGLYGGPCYTIFKALTAVHMARQLTAGGLPAVPVFWLATEDHDFEEIDHSWVFDEARLPVKVRAKGDHRAQQPVGPVRITELPDFSDDLAAKHYRVGATFGDAFRGLVREVLGEFEVLFLDPLCPDIWKIAAPFLREAAAQSPKLRQQVIERSAELVDAGYHAQVLFEGKDASLFFVLENGRRRLLKPQDLATYSGPAENLSPNALLRPVMQDYLLPTTAMIGGPAEIAYLAQSGPLYDELLGRQPQPVPRAGFTLLDSRAVKLMDRYKLRLPDLTHPEAEVRERIAARLVPASLEETFERAGKDLAWTLESVSAQLAQFDRTLADSFTVSRRKIAYQLSKARAKTAREMLRRSEKESADANYLIQYIYPHRHLQERVYSILPFLDQHGPDLTGRIYENIHLNCPDHHVLPL